MPLTIRQPQVAEVYYPSCAQIDRHFAADRTIYGLSTSMAPTIGRRE